MEFIKLDADTAFQRAVDSIGENKQLVVCGSKEDRQYIEEAVNASKQSAEDIIAGAEKIDIQAWFNQRKAELSEDAEIDLEQVAGQWLGESEAKQGFTLAFDMMTGEPLSDLVGAELVSGHSWQAPAYFKYGGWNDCPEPELHCAIWQYWQEKYGAHIVGLSNDVIEAYVMSPPQTQEAAMELAWEQYIYCHDIVDQGMESISNLAASIINHNAWFFWWD